MTLAVGDVVGPIEVGPIAHGGHWVARHDGMVIFVRHALEGEVVTVRITETTRRFARADVHSVHHGSPYRRTPACAIAGECGGCDFQHVEVSHSRELKRQVVVEHLRKVGVEYADDVVGLEPDSFGWRTRMRYHATDAGTWGLRAHRSAEVIELPADGCLLAVSELSHPSPAQGTTLVGAAGHDRTVWVEQGDTAPILTERADGRAWKVAADGFWQVHSQAADVLAGAVVEALLPEPGEVGLDLFCGVGLFAGVLSARGVTMHGIEGNRRAVETARRNVPEATFAVGDVQRVLRRWNRPVDLVVLDPPRTGAGIPLMKRTLELGARAVAYVACDPAAFARDLKVALEEGWALSRIQAFDLFPMTHHIELVALLTSSKAAR